MVAHPLHQVAQQFGVEERHGELKQLNEEVAHQRYVDAHGDVEQQPSSDEVYRRTAESQHQLSKQDQPDEAYILISDANVDNRLGEERQDELRTSCSKLPTVRPRTTCPKYLLYFLT